MGVNVSKTKKATTAKAGVATAEIFLEHGVSHRFMGTSFVQGVVYVLAEDVAEQLLALEISGIQKFNQAGIKQKTLPRVKVGLELPENPLAVGDDDEITAHLKSGAEGTGEGEGTGAENGTGEDGKDGTDESVSV